MVRMEYFVSNKKKKIVGIITDADIRKKLLQEQVILVNQRAASIPEKTFFTAFHSQKEIKRKLLLESNKILIPILKNNF